MSVNQVLGLLAAAYRQAGQTEEGFAHLSEAFEVIDESGGRWYEAELYRLKGELLLQQANQKSKIETEPQNREVTDDAIKS